MGNEVKKLSSWMEMVGALASDAGVAVKDLKDGECFIIDCNWVSFIMRFQLFRDGYDYFTF